MSCSILLCPLDGAHTQIPTESSAWEGSFLQIDGVHINVNLLSLSRVSYLGSFKCDGGFSVLSAGTPVGVGKQPSGTM